MGIKIWEKSPYWLKGSIIALLIVFGISTAIFILDYALLGCQRWADSAPLYCGLPFISIIPGQWIAREIIQLLNVTLSGSSQLKLIFLMSLIFYMVLGAIIALVIRLIKNKKEEIKN